MNIRHAALATLIAATLPVAVKAEEPSDAESYAAVGFCEHHIREAVQSLQSYAETVPPSLRMAEAYYTAVRELMADELMARGTLVFKAQAHKLSSAFEMLHCEGEPTTCYTKFFTVCLIDAQNALAEFE